MDNFPRVTAILSRIPDAATRWPGWFWPCCPECGETCLDDTSKDPFCDNPDCHTHFEKITPIYRFAPPTDGDGPDVWRGGDTSPENMHHLWEVLRAVCDNPEIDMAQVSHWIAGKRFAYHYNPNIIEAMLRCLEATVDIETNKENNNDPQ